MMENMNLDSKGVNSGFKKLGIFIIAFLFFFFIDRAAIYLTDLVLVGSFGFTWFSAHHVLQIVFAVIIMALPFWHRSLYDWGFNVKNSKQTFDILLKFSIGWVIFTTIFTLLTQWLSGWPELLGFYLSTENILIYLFFESIIVGISEEIVFRGLVYGILSPYFNRKITIGFSISIAGIISAIFFTVAHIGFQFFPFSITSIAPMQLVVAFCLGIFYAVLREKTGSLLGPILAHNISDGWLSILYIVIQLSTTGK